MRAQSCIGIPRLARSQAAGRYEGYVRDLPQAPELVLVRGRFGSNCDRGVAGSCVHAMCQHTNIWDMYSSMMN